MMDLLSSQHPTKKRRLHKQLEVAVSCFINNMTGAVFIYLSCDSFDSVIITTTFSNDNFVLYFIQ